MNCDSKKIFFSSMKSFFICAIAEDTTLQCWYSGKHVTCIWSIARRKEKAGKIHRQPKSRVLPDTAIK